MKQSEAQAKYAEFRDKIKATEKPQLIGMAVGLERLQLKNDLNHFRLQCADEGITLLEPCPFCGSYNVQIHDPKYDEYNEGEFVECEECDAKGPRNSNSYPSSESIAIAAWNTRVN